MKQLCLASVFALISMPVVADEFTSAIESFYESEISKWANNPAIIAAITAQNADTAAFDQARIDALDQAWRAEVGLADAPTISSVISNGASEFLRARVAQYGGQITEIFVMDSIGLNVAASDVTSDYWQGDEAKFSETFSVGADGFHVSDVELDESTQRYQGQVSFTLLDPGTGAPIGAMTVGIDAESLM
jgi:hypothetical protein